MEVNVLWQSSESHRINSGMKLKDFLNSSSSSICMQLPEQDYSLKFNNNNLNKIMMNNQIKDLIEKFHGGRIDIAPSSHTILELEDLLKASEQKEVELSRVKHLVNVSMDLSAIDFKKIELKMKSLIKPLNEENIYYGKVKEKIVKGLSMYDAMFKEVGDMKENFLKLKINENIAKYTKITNYCLKDSFDFFYKYGKLFLAHKDYLRKYTEVYTKVYKDFLVLLNSQIKASLPVSDTLTFDNSLFTELEKNLYEYRIVKYVEGEPPSSVFFSFDAEVKINISESEYREIKSLLSQFPSFTVIQQSLPMLSNEDFISRVFALILERDLMIYENYGIKMEDFIYAILLYDI